MDIELELKDLIARYRICWSTGPRNAVVHGTLRQTGYRLELHATHPPDVKHADPGCVHCQEVWAALKKVADWVIPAGVRESNYDIEPFDQAIHYSSARSHRPDVELHIRIVHRSGFGPVDASEANCLKEMTEKLERLGCLEDRYSRQPRIP